MYRLIYGRDPELLEEKLNEAYEDGWKLVGPVQTCYGTHRDGEDFLLLLATLYRWD